MYFDFLTHISHTHKNLMKCFVLSELQVKDVLIIFRKFFNGFTGGTGIKPSTLQLSLYYTVSCNKYVVLDLSAGKNSAVGSNDDRRRIIRRQQIIRSPA